MNLSSAPLEALVAGHFWCSREGAEWAFSPGGLDGSFVTDVSELWHLHLAEWSLTLHLGCGCEPHIGLL